MTITRQTIIQAICIMLVIGVYSLWLTGDSYREIQNPVPLASSDTWTIGNIFLKQTNPDLFLTDTYYDDTRYIDFYTPSYLAILKVLAPIAGDYLGALVLLQGILLVIYLTSMTAFFGYLAKSSIVGLIASMLSVNAGRFLIGYWGLYAFKDILPRSVALSVIGVIVFIFWVIVNDDVSKRYLWWIIVGLGIGSLAHLHPTTGMILAMILGTIVILRWIQTRTMRPMSLVMMILGTVLAGLPLVFTVFGSEGSSAEALSFAQYAQLFEGRVSGFPYGFARFALVPDDIRIVGILIWGIVSLVAFVLHRPNERSPWMLLWMVLQWVAMATVSEFSWQILLAIALIMGWMWVHEKDESLTFTLIFSMAVVGISLVFDILLYGVWSQFELISLTTIVAEIPRGIRLMVIPMIAVLMIGVREIVLPHWRSQSAIRSWAEVILVLSIYTIWSQPILFFVGGALFLTRGQSETWANNLDTDCWRFGFWAIASVLFSMMLFVFNTPTMLVNISRYVQASLIAIALLIVLGGLLNTWLARRWMLVAGMLVSIVGIIAMLIYRPTLLTVMVSSPLWQVWTGGIVLALAIHFVWMRQQDLRWFAVPFSAMVIVIAGLSALERFNYLSLVPDEDVPQSYVARLSDWLRINTDVDSLLYNATLNNSHTPAYMRYTSQRSMVFSYKDWNMVAYSIPQDLPAIAEYETSVAELSAEEQIADAFEQEADYILIPADEMPETLPDTVVPAYIAEADFILRLNPPEPLSEPIDIFNDVLALYGASTARDTIAPCRTISVDSWWQLSQMSEVDYRIHLELKADYGRVVALSDSSSLAHVDTTDWQVETLYLAIHGLRIPCDTPVDDDYSLSLVLDDGENLSYILVDTITVE